MMPIIIPRLEDPSAASVDERDEHLMLLEAARHALDVEWTETVAAAERAADHDVMGYPSMVAYLKHRMRMAGGRAYRYVRIARAATKHAATFSAWRHRQISGDEAELMFRHPSVFRTSTPRRRVSFSSSTAMVSTRPGGSWSTGEVT
jgi:hypothetical protein